MAPPVLHTVLVPGLLGSARLWEPLIPRVWCYGAVTVADNRRDSSVTAMAQRLLGTAPDRFVLAGLSMGGYVALEVMRIAPERVEALALISTSARPDSPEQRASRRRQEAAVGEGRFSELVETFFPALVDEGNVDRTDLADTWRRMAHEVGPDAFLTQLHAATSRPDSRPDLAAIRCPTVVVHGQGDRFITPENAVEMADGIDGSELTVVARAGHMVAHEQPDALAGVFGQLLDAVSAR